MNIKRIEISIKNKRRFGLVAFLVDRSDFLTDIEEARNLLNLKRFPYTFPTFSYKEANNVTHYYKQGICSIYDVCSSLKDICREKNINLAELDKTIASVFVLTKSLAKKYRKSGVYLSVILSSILIGEVKEDDILPTNTFEIDQQSIEEFDERFRGYKKTFGIIVNSESTWKEVKEAFTNIQKYRLGIKEIKNKEEDTFYKIYREELIADYLPDTISNIRRDRDWHWQHEKGMSYEKIRKNFEKIQPVTWQAVRNSIARYKAHLT